MNTTYQIHFVGLGVFYADSSEAVEALASLCRDDKVKGFVLSMLAKGVINDIALNNLDFLFSRCKGIYDSDSFYCRVVDVLNWGLKHLLGYAVTVPVEEHFETNGVECYSKEINYKNALDLLDYWKERQRLEAGEAGEADAESQSSIPVVEDVSAVGTVPVVTKSNIKSYSIPLEDFFNSEEYFNEFEEESKGNNPQKIAELANEFVRDRKMKQLAHGRSKETYKLIAFWEALYNRGFISIGYRSFRKYMPYYK